MHSAKTQGDAESGIVEKLMNMPGESVSYAIKKSVKNGFISKRMFNVYDGLVKRHCRGFTFSDVVLTLQAYALCKQRNFEVYSILSSRALRLLRGVEAVEEEAAREKREDDQCGERDGGSREGGEAYDPERHNNIYRYILASNQLNYSDFELMQLLVGEIKRHFHRYEMKRLCSLLHALTKLKINDAELLDGACHHIVGNFKEVRCNHVNHLISAYSPKTSGGNHEELLLRLVKFICENVKAMDSISVYNTLVQIGPILQRLSRRGGGEVGEEEAPRRGEVDENRNNDDEQEYCHLAKSTHGGGPPKGASGKNSSHSSHSSHSSSLGAPVDRVVPLLFARVNSCIAFLSLKQLTKLMCAYRELNYFNYTFVYKRLLAFLLSKLRTQHKALPGEYIIILEFFTFLPYVDGNMKECVEIITGNIPKVLSYNYVHLCRLLHCCKRLSICDDAILSRVDHLVFRNRSSFERISTVDQINLFLQVYSQGSGEWDEMLSFLRALVEQKAAAEGGAVTSSDSSGTSASSCSSGTSASSGGGGPAQSVVITYKYSKAHKCFHEYGREVSVEGASTGEGGEDPDPLLPASQGDAGGVGSLAPSPGSASQTSKAICDYLYVNMANERGGV
ncbi:hypothetical protein PVIIG_05048 [Plasmodium vivax India VII]|uniref:Uncharacterized protein n=1 Tax=Plasmodium vivax India VII TaxID=1077284 RepID=A0A0J9SI54_PLAVI|nr:hypothetical protein PVIIG_05048 [Plasmodium vivax India VII]